MAGRIERARIVVLGIVVLAAVAIAGTLASETQARRPSGQFGASVVLSPRNGQRVTSRPVPLKVQLGGASLVRARLNGRPILSQFQLPGQPLPCAPVLSSRGTICQVMASPSDGLRFGSNALAVSFRRGHRLVSRTIRFSVAGNRPLAAAGRDRTVELGRQIRLNGRPSLMVPGLRQRLVRQGRRASLRYRWQMVGKPPRRAGTFWSVSAKLSGANTATPSVKLIQAGAYRLRLTVTQPNGRSASDAVTLTVPPGLVDQPPAVTVDTMAQQDGSYGILVGDQFYPASAAGWLQVLVLDRGTLGLLSNKTFPCSGAAFGKFGNCPDQVASALSQYGKDALVIVSAQPDASDAPFGVASNNALARIGITHDDFPAEDSNRDKLARGTFSGIGVPTGDRKLSVAHSAADNRPGGGRITGYLFLDNKNDYVYASSDQGIQFSTQTNGSNASNNVIQVGGTSYSAAVGAQLTDGGFQVVVVDRDTLTGTSTVFDTSAPFAGGKNLTVLRAMLTTLTQADSSSDLVFIVSRGNPTVKVPIDQHSPFADLQQAGAIDTTMKDIGDRIESLGGTRNGFFTAVDPALSKQTSYTLVGGSKFGAGLGEESTAGGTASQHVGMNTAPLEGQLGRTGHDYGFEPQAEGPLIPIAGDGDQVKGAAQLSGLTFRPPSLWPEQDPAITPDPATRAREAAAINYVGQQVFGGDVRLQYYSLPYDQGTWKKAQQQIQDVSEQSRPPSVGLTDLRWAKTELQREITSLINEHTYLSQLSQPFANDALTSWAQFTKISNSIRDKVKISGNPLADQNFKEVFNLIRGLAGDIPGAGKVIEPINQIYDLVAGLVEINSGEPADSDFQSHADDAGVEMTTRLQAAQQLLTTQIPNVIAADYTKLMTAGSCSSPFRNEYQLCPAGYDHDDWTITPQRITAASNALLPQLQVAAYKALLPAKYDLYQLPPWWRTKVNGYTSAVGGDLHKSDFFGNTLFGTCATCYPFEAEPETGQYAKPILRTIPIYSHAIAPNGSFWTNVGDTWQIYALGDKDGNGTIDKPWLMHVPDAEITDALFKPPPEGLGVYPETFFDGAFKPAALDHFPWKDSDTGWCVRYYTNIDYQTKCNQ